MGRNTLTYMGFITLACVVLFLFAGEAIFGVSVSGSSFFNNVYSTALLSMVAMGVLIGYRPGANIALKQTLAWSGIPVVALVLFNYPPSLIGLGLSSAENAAGSSSSSSARAQPVQSNGRSGVVIIRAGQGGHYFASASISGHHVEFLIDTGATLVSLSALDAQRIGFDFNDLSFDLVSRTANGTAMKAYVQLPEVTVGDITVRDVPAAVSREGLDQSLLGMSFLSELSGFELDGDTLVMRR